MHNMIKIEYGSETKRTIHYQCAAYVPVIAPHLMTTYIQIFKSTTEKLWVLLGVRTYVWKNGCFKPKNCMSGYDFELWVQGILTALKFNAKRTAGNDNGVDIMATLNEGGNVWNFVFGVIIHQNFERWVMCMRVMDIVEDLLI